MSNTIEELMKGLYPYADEYGVIRRFPEEGRATGSILEELRAIASKEDEAWENGKCSGTMYSGDHEHYDFLNSVFSLFSYVNSLQRDLCPSMTRFEGEIIAMALDLMIPPLAANSSPHVLKDFILPSNHEKIIISTMASLDINMDHAGLNARLSYDGLHLISDVV